MKVDVSRGKVLEGFNPNNSRKRRRYKAKGMSGTSRLSLAERLRIIKNHEHKHGQCSCGHNHEEGKHDADHQ